MGDLYEPIHNRLGEIIRDLKLPPEHLAIRFVNTSVSPDYDIEHVITFLEQSPSAPHRRVANIYRKAFYDVLREHLSRIEEEAGEKPADLYAYLLDMYQLVDCHEDLRGILTINYDDYIEHAIEKVLGLSVDYGVEIGSNQTSPRAIPLLKLHGSFSWEDTWPITDFLKEPLWIPPGIQKAKSNYPFNVLWGRARELLDCDVLRVVGLNLGPNDWDLISLLFSSQHTSSTGALRCRIEVIDKPRTAARIQEQFPYLEVRSLLELDGIGEHFVSELTGRAPTALTALPEETRAGVITAANDAIANPFYSWLKLTAESLLLRREGQLNTPTGLFRELAEGATQ